MRSIFRSRKRSKKVPSLPALRQAAEQISQRGDFIEKKIRKLDAELVSLGEQIKKTKPGPTRDALKAHAHFVLKQKRRYEAQKVMLESQKKKLECASCAAEELRKGKKTVFERLLSFASWNFCK